MIKIPPIGEKQKKLLSVFIYHLVLFLLLSQRKQTKCSQQEGIVSARFVTYNLPIFTARPYDLHRRLVIFKCSSSAAQQSNLNQVVCSKLIMFK